MPSTHQNHASAPSERGLEPAPLSWKEGAIAGCARSMFEIWRHGDRACPRNLDWLRRSAAKGHSAACTALALLILDDPRGDIGEAFSLLDDAVAGGCPAARSELLFAKATTAADHADQATAVGALRRIAAQGDMIAATLLGRLLSRPDFRHLNEYAGEAHAHLSTAAESGSAYAQHLLGAMHAQGMTATWCSQTSFEWFHRAAQQGDREAALKVARRFLVGRGVEQDLTKALFWLRVGLRPSPTRSLDGAVFSLSRSLGLSVDRISERLGFERSRAVFRDAGAWAPTLEVGS